MNTVGSLLVCLFALTVHASDLRLVGTNLFDFSGAGHGIYYLGGFHIVKTFSQSIQIRQTRVFQKFIPDMARLYGDYSADLARATDYWEPNYYGKMENPYHDKIYENWKIMSRIATSPNLTASTAEYYGIPGNEVQIVTNITLHVLNHPGGSNVDYCAVPTATPGFWDHGIPFTGTVEEYKYIYHVLPDYIVRIYMTNSPPRDDAVILRGPVTNYRPPLSPHNSRLLPADSVMGANPSAAVPQTECF
jgi:hypothetical protein